MQANQTAPSQHGVMPCYNNATYVRQAVDNVLKQDCLCIATRTWPELPCNIHSGLAIDVTASMRRS